MGPMSAQPMFLPPALTKAANAAVVWGASDQFVRFRKPAKLLPEVVPGAVLRYSTTTPAPEKGTKNERTAA
jgi:hypothetical protein